MVNLFEILFKMVKQFKYHLLNILLVILILFSSCLARSKDSETQFWQWFMNNNIRLFELKDPQEKLFDELSTQLHKVDPNLTFEFSPFRSDSVREFTISADGIRKYFPLVKSLVSKAPHIDKWKFYAFRQRVPDDHITLEYDKKTKIGYDDIFFRKANDSGKIAIEINVRNLIESNSFKNAVYILLDSLIGEYDMETQLSTIEFVKLDENKTSELMPIIKLRTIVDENKKLHSN